VSTRLRYADNLKTLLIGAIIVVHAVLGYAGTVEVWTYTEFREATLAGWTEAILFVGVGPFALFVIPLFFLVAGLLTPGSLERKGLGRFVRERLLRLGLPFVVYVLLVQPALKYALVHSVDPEGPYGDLSFGDLMLVEGRLDTGPLWFVGVLLVFSLAWAGWAAFRPRSPDRPPATLSLVAILLLAAAVAPASFAVRVLYPYGSESGFTDLSLWEWPACAAVLGLGVAGARGTLAQAVPPDLARGCRTVTLVAAGTTAALMVTVAMLDRVDDALGGWGWPAAAFAAGEAVLTLTGSVWLLSLAQRHLERGFPGDRVLNRAAYGAFMLQTVFLLGTAVLLRPVGVPPEVKAVLVAAGALVCSFAVAHTLVRRVPGFARLL
jgi:peptidoglycan/LPS O-acetylase OafA/YrhL